MVPPGAAMAANRVLSELRPNLDLSIGTLLNPWCFAPSFLSAMSQTFPMFLRFTCWVYI